MTAQGESYGAVRSDCDAACIGGGYAYAAHGKDVVLLAFTQDVGWWRNSVAFTPDDARRIAAALIQHADATEKHRSVPDA